MEGEFAQLKKRRLIAVLLLFAVFLSGCGGTVPNALQNLSQLSESVSIGAGSGAGSAWTNSEIIGAISEKTEADVKDDFFTAVNKDWILENAALLNPDDPQAIAMSLIAPQEKLLDERISVLLTDPDSTGYRSNTTVGLSREELAHLGEILSAFTAAAGNAEKRNSEGTEPLRPYIDAIMGISDMDEMTAYLLDAEGKNLVGPLIVDLAVAPLDSDPDTNHLVARPVSKGELSLEEIFNYSNISPDGIIAKEKISALVHMVLSKLGWSKSEINALVRQCFRFEMRLVEKMERGTEYNENYEAESSSECTPEELQSLLGEYPVSGAAELYGFGDAEKITVFEPDYMKNVAKLYSSRYLEEMKAFYAVRTIYACADLLDDATKAETYDIIQRGYGSDEADGEADEASREKSLLNDYIRPYLSEPFEMLYIAAYCTGEQKAELMEMAVDIRAAFREIIAAQEWLTDYGREKCLEKLDSMSMRVLFPDTYTSYLGLDLKDDMSLIEMVSRIRLFTKQCSARDIGQPVRHERWDLGVLPTTMANAVYVQNENAMNILAGIVCDGFTFDPDAPYEVNLARLGTTIGHEITHGFDSAGCMFDKYGRVSLGVMGTESLMTMDEKTAFTKKTLAMGTWFQAVSPMPGKDTYPAPVTTEATADMGGMKCALAVAEKAENFDYDLFFRSYAQLWRKVNSRDMELMYISSDMHPLAYLRTNVTLQQFDKFLETYGIVKGDGMYIAPEKRILIW